MHPACSHRDNKGGRRVRSALSNGDTTDFTRKWLCLIWWEEERVTQNAVCELRNAWISAKTVSAALQLRNAPCISMGRSKRQETFFWNVYISEKAMNTFALCVYKKEEKFNKFLLQFGHLLIFSMFVCYVCCRIGFNKLTTVLMQQALSKI
jgi:hypothetical protein